MLASKAPYATPLGVPPSQTPTTSYHTGPQKSAVFPNSQDGALFTSPTESEFSGGHDGLDAVR